MKLKRKKDLKNARSSAPGIFATYFGVEKFSDM